MTTIIHDGKEYDFLATLTSPPIGAVDELNQALGVTPKTIRTYFGGLSAVKKEPGYDTEELLYSHDYITNFAGLIFLAKRRGGDPFTIAQAQGISYTDVVMRDDTPDGEDEEEVPKVPSVPDGADEVKQPEPTL